MRSWADEGSHWQQTNNQMGEVGEDTAFPSDLRSPAGSPLTHAARGRSVLLDTVHKEQTPRAQSRESGRPGGRSKEATEDHQPEPFVLSFFFLIWCANILFTVFASIFIMKITYHFLSCTIFANFFIKDMLTSWFAEYSPFFYSLEEYL